MEKKLSYESSGVSIDEGNRAVELMKKSVKSTYDKNVLGDIGLFSGTYSLKDFKGMEEPCLLSATDGVGTKLVIANKMNRYDTVGIDLVAMCVNDLICQGAKPLFFLDYIAGGKIDAEEVANVVEGISKGCIEAGCSLIGGETAEMPGMYSVGEYDLAGFSVGICDREKIITGKNVKEGDVLIGLQSSGFHSNGYSLARKLFLNEMGWSLDKELDNKKTLGENLIEPTKIYVKEVLALIEKFEIKGIAHITGGGLLENVPRFLPEGLGAVIEKNSFEKPYIFKLVEELDKIEENELYRSFNMGIGLVIAVEKSIADQVIESISNDNKAWKIGEVVKGTGVQLI